MGKAKSLIKKSLSAIDGKPISKLNINSITQPWVSFDLFDTLVVRNCEKPSDVFYIVENRYNKEYTREKISGFYNNRINAEKQARENSNNEEIQLDEIYRILSAHYGNEVASKLKQIEVDTEITICVPNTEMMDFYNNLLGENKNILIISDMYLPKDVIQKIIDRCGITGYKKFYVSSNRNATKRSGRLFDIACKENGIKEAQLFHIGDHPLADYLVPRRKGIGVFLYKRRILRSHYLRDIKPVDNIAVTEEDERQYRILRQVSINSSAAVIKALPSDQINVYNAGNQVLGPMLYGYSIWLHNWISSNQIKSIFFLSREGKLLMESYKALFEVEDVAIHYINVSRLALCRASIIKTTSYDNLIDLMSSLLRSVNDVGEFIDLLGISNKLDDICKDINCDKTTQLNAIDKTSFYDSVMKEGYFYFKDQNDYLNKYLVDKGMREGTIAISDIGWSGTMQLCLSQFLPDCKFIGNYLAVSSFNNKEGYVDLRRRGFWCTANEWNTKGQLFRFTTSAIEEIFMSEEGTTLEYRLDRDTVVPVKEERIISEPIKRRINSIWQGAHDFVSNCKEWKVNHIISEPSSYACLWPFFNFAVFPNEKSVEIYKGSSFINGMRTISVLPTHSFAFYLLHPKATKRELEDNVNKIIWLKALCKIPFPYYKLLCILTGKLGMKSEYQKKVFNQ